MIELEQWSNELFHKSESSFCIFPLLHFSNTPMFLTLPLLS